MKIIDLKGIKPELFNLFSKLYDDILLYENKYGCGELISSINKNDVTTEHLFEHFETWYFYESTTLTKLRHDLEKRKERFKLSELESTVYQDLVKIFEMTNSNDYKNLEVILIKYKDMQG